MAQVTTQSPWLSDNLPDAVKADSNFVEKCQDIAADIQGNNVKLVTLVERLGAVLTDPDPHIRARGTQVLAHVLANLPKDFLLETELIFLTVFFVDRLADHHSVVPSVLQGILSIAEMANAPKDIAVKVLRAIFQHVQCQTMKPEDRRNIYKIFQRFILTYSDDLKALGPDFVYGFISAIDQEKDARNLLLVFDMLPFFIRTFNLGHLKEEMFEVISVYFPVDYRSEFSSSPVSREQLADALHICLTASPDFAEFCLPLIIEKLDSKLKQAKMDSFKVLIAGCEVFPVESIRVFLLDIWRTIHHEILPGSDKEVRELGLSALRALVRTMSSTALDQQDAKALSSIMSFVLNAGLSALTEVELNLFLPAVRMLLTVAEASPAACFEIIGKVKPVLMQQYYRETGSEQKVMVLLSLNSFTAVGIAQRVTAIDSGAAASLWADMSALLLGAAQSEDLQIRKEGFHGLAVAASVLSGNDRSAVYDLLNLSIRKENEEPVRVEVLKCLQEVSKIYPDEVLKSIVNSRLMDIKGCSESSFEEMLLSLEALCGIAHTEPFTGVIVPCILEMIIDSYNVGKCTVGMKCLRKLLESASNSDSGIFKYMYSDCETVSRLVSWWLQGAVTNENSEVFESEDMLINTAAIIDIIVRNQDVETQKEIVCAFLPQFVIPRESESEGPRFDPLNQSSPWKQTQLVAILEALLGSVRTGAPIPFLEKLVDSLVHLSIQTNHHATHRSACRLTANLINKAEDDEPFVKILQNVFEECHVRCMENRQNAVNVMVWVTKALVMRGHREVDKWVQGLLELLANPDLGMATAQAFSIIMKDMEYLSPSNFCCIRILYRQRFFSVTPKLVEAFRSAAEQVRANYLVALGHLLQGVPREVLLMDLQGMVPLLVESLSQPESLLLLTTLDTVLSVLEESALALQEHLQTFIPRILALTEYQNSMRVRMKALQCINYFSKYPTELILPFRPKVLQSLGRCLDDRKRLVRREAVRARSKWFLVGTSGVLPGVVKYGAYRYEDGTRYVGNWNDKGQKHGMGHLELPDGTRYDGRFQNGLCSGLGVMCFPDGAKYEGEFMQGWFHGHGVFWRADGMRFEGEFRGGRIWGLGLVTFSDESHGFPRNEGFFQDCRLVRKKSCPEVVQRAQKVAFIARAQCDQQ